MKQLKKMDAWLWNPESPYRVMRYIIQIIYRLVQKFVDDNFKERAQSLTYTTLLSLVPLLAISFSVLKGFGVHHQLIPLMVKAISFLGEEEARRLVVTMTDFVDNAKGVVHGGMGLLVFFYTVVNLITTIENAFNRIWGVVHGRSFRHRVMNYLVVVMTGPVVAFAIVSLLSSELIVRFMGGMTNPLLNLVVGKALTITVMTLLILFAYLFVVNRRVKFFPALLAAFIASNSWYLVGQLFTHFVVMSGKQSQIYSGFASVVLFIMWMYLSWLIILLGNQLAFYFQFPESLQENAGRGEPLGRVTLQVTLEANDHYNHDWVATAIETKKYGNRDE